jgi:hypothetical protein
MIDANYGFAFINDGQGSFRYLSQKESGLKLTGDVKSLTSFQINGKLYLAVGTNNSKVQTYQINEKSSDLN